LTPSSPSNLTAEEVVELKYKVLEQLKKFKIYLTEKIPQQTEDFEKQFNALQELLDKERVENEAKLTSLQQKLATAAESENLTQQQLTYYKNAWELCSKAGKRSKTCWLKKLVSFGGWKCH
jgi:aminopeptidase-like protein